VAVDAINGTVTEYGVFNNLFGTANWMLCGSMFVIDAIMFVGMVGLYFIGKHADARDSQYLSMDGSA